MPINLTPYLTASGGLGEIPQDTLSGIRTLAFNGGAQVQMGSTIVTIRSVFLGFFMGSVSPEGLSERALRTALNNVNRLERDLNGGLSGRQILASIPSPYEVASVCFSTSSFCNANRVGVRANRKMLI